MPGQYLAAEAERAEGYPGNHGAPAQDRAKPAKVYVVPGFTETVSCQTVVFGVVAPFTMSASPLRSMNENENWPGAGW